MCLPWKINVANSINALYRSLSILEFKVQTSYLLTIAGVMVCSRRREHQTAALSLRLRLYPLDVFFVCTSVAHPHFDHRPQ